MRITADTNILVRAVMQDDRQQAAAANRVLQQAELIAIPLSCLCEFSWVLKSVYKLNRDRIAASILSLSHAANVSMDRAAVEAGLALHHAGGDFADGVIAYDGRHLGGEVFASMDKRAVSLIGQQGYETYLVE